MVLRPLLGAAIPVPDFEPAALDVLERLQDAIDESIAPLAETHDIVGRYPTASIQALKRTGILASAVPARLGGMDVGHLVSMEAQVRLAVADSSVAQIFKVHDELVREIFEYCPEEMAPELADAVTGGAVLGLAVAEDGRTVDVPMATTAKRRPDGSFLLNGTKIYTTGAAEADLIAVWAFDPDADVPPGLQLNLVPGSAPGVTIHRDWDTLGQRATDSGRVTFNDVATEPRWRASSPDVFPGTDRPLRYQAGFAAILVGLGVAAIADAGRFLHATSRPWPSSGVESASQDPLVQRLAGELSADVAAAYSLVVRGAELLDRFKRGGISRTELAVPISVAKSVATRAALRATNEVFGLMGTRSTRRGHPFDRYWRNARTISLHDPVEWKNFEIGNNVLNGWDPPFGIYT